VGEAEFIAPICAARAAAICAWQGACAWGDADGDKIFTSYVGKVSTSGALDGMNNITGGTGKFDGIQGRARSTANF
jgi:hypothetical protein